MTGIHSIPAEQYHKANGVSNSSLKWIAAPKTPAHYKAKFIDKLIPDEESDALTFGSLVHRAILEPDTIDGAYVVKPDGMTFASKEGKAWKAEQEGKTIVTEAQHVALVRMKASVWSHAAAAKLIRNSEHERSLFVEEDGLLLKSRFDCLPHSGNAIVDVKTCQDADTESVERAIGQYGYHRQAGFYTKVAQLLGMDRTQFVFIFVEKTPPFAVAVYQLDPLAIDCGRKAVNRDLTLLRECIATDTWPGYGNGVSFASLPPWMMRELEQAA